MATDTHKPPTAVSSGAPQGKSPACPRRGVGAVVHGLAARVTAAAVWLFTLGSKSRRVPVVHENVVLTPEGAKVWEQVADPKSPVGKPVGRRRRLADGDAGV